MENDSPLSIYALDSKAFLAAHPAQPEQKAILTHYLHNIGSPAAEHYRAAALQVLSELVAFANVEKQAGLTEERALDLLLAEARNVPFPTPAEHSFTFIDLFAGIGGFRLAMQNAGGKCVFTSEWNKDAQITYRANFGEVPFGDITKQETKDCIPPSFDVLCAGFPCQAFSIAGYRKGFSDTRGTLFFDLEQIIQKHRPKAIFLENVKNLVSHDGGNTFKIIADTLENKLGYKISYTVLNSMTHANIPQNRERIFIAGFDPAQVSGFESFSFPGPEPLTATIHDILGTGLQPEQLYYKPTHPYYPALQEAMVSRDTVYQWRRVYARENKSNVCPTLTANMGAGGHNVPLVRDNFGIRKLSPRECFAFQGYPMDAYLLPPIASSKLYMQAGNSVTTTLVEKIGRKIVELL